MWLQFGSLSQVARLENVATGKWLDRYIHLCVYRDEWQAYVKTGEEVNGKLNP